MGYEPGAYASLESLLCWTAKSQVKDALLLRADMDALPIGERKRS